MHIILEFLIFCLDPLRICRTLVFTPTTKLLSKVYDNLKPRANEKFNTIQAVVLQAGLTAFSVVLIIWTAIFITCLDTGEPCSFPNAHVPLTRKQQLLMVGQAYRIGIDIDMPESQQNLDLGMFMVCVELRDTQSILRGHSCRSAMMRYRSALIRTMSTWVWSPFYVLGLRNEHQNLAIEIFPQFLEQPHHPITDVYVEIQSKKIQFYKVSLHIVADFTGLRYIMYNWPILSAIVAISTNLFFLLMVFLMSWYHCSDSRWLHNLQYKYNLLTALLQDNIPKSALFSSKTNEHLRDEDDGELSCSFNDEKSHLSDIENLDAAATMRRLSTESF